MSTRRRHLPGTARSIVVSVKRKNLPMAAAHLAGSPFRSSGGHVRILEVSGEHLHRAAPDPAPAPASPDQMAPEIRPVAADEVDEAGAVTLAAYQSLPGFPVGGRYAADLRDVGARSRGATVLVAVENGRVLGTVTLVDDPSSPWSESLRPEEVGLRMLGVDPVFHGRGIGTALLEACLDRARAMGALRAVLHSTSSMTVAHRLYRRAGFQRTPERDVMLPDFHLMAFTLDLR